MPKNTPTGTRASIYYYTQPPLRHLAVQAVMNRNSVAKMATHIRNRVAMRIRRLEKNSGAVIVLYATECTASVSGVVSRPTESRRHIDETWGLSGIVLARTGNKGTVAGSVCRVFGG